MPLPSNPTEHPEYAEWLPITPQLYLHCRFNPLYSALNGYREEPLTSTEASALAQYRQHCQQALKTLYDTLGAFPADNLPIRTPATTFTILSRDYAVYGSMTVLQLNCNGPDVLQPLPAPVPVRAP